MNYADDENKEIHINELNFRAGNDVIFLANNNRWPEE